MSRNLRIAAILCASFSLSVYFVNCAGGLPDVSQENTAASTAATKPLKLTLIPSQVTLNAASQSVAEGGVPPYTFKISSGTAMINSYGNISQTALAGSVLVEVADGKGDTAFASLTVSPAVIAAPSNCTTPWGVSIPNGGTAQGFAGSTAACPASCTPVTVSCTNGSLSNPGGATAAGCSNVSCVYKQDADGTCPNSPGMGAIGGAKMGTATPIPATCSPAEYHTYLCNAAKGAVPAPGVSGYGEFHCVSPNEAP